MASEVRFAGLPVGKVIGMGLSPAGDGTVRVEIEVRQGTPVRRDSVATLDMQGVTGVAPVGISAGSPGQPLLKDDETEVPVIPVSRSTLPALGDEGAGSSEGLAGVPGEGLGRREGMGVWDTDGFGIRASADAQVLVIEVPMR